MAKTNFSKVELALEEGLRKITVSKLCALADVAAGIGKSVTPQDEITKSQKTLIKRLDLDLMRLQKKEKKLYTKLKIKKSILKEKLSHPEKLTENDWKKLKSLHKKTQALIVEYYPELSDEEMIDKEQERHLTKRFNVNEKWLPL